MTGGRGGEGEWRGEDQHVFPLDDEYQHTLIGTDCWCCPRVEIEGATLVIIHNSWGSRGARTMYKLIVYFQLEGVTGKAVIFNVTDFQVRTTGELYIICGDKEEYLYAPGYWYHVHAINQGKDTQT